MGKNKKNRNKLKQEVVAETRQQKKSARPLVKNLPSGLVLSLCIFLALLAGVLYGSTYNHDFAYDDLAVIKENRFVQQGTAGIPDILGTQYFEGYDPGSNARAYRPVSLVMYALEVEFFGLNPSVHHFVSILFYALTAIVLLLALIRLLRNYHWSLAFITALLFIVHPVHVDVVANIKSRDELMGFFNFCVALLFLLEDLDKPAWWKKLVSWAFFYLALASKENLVTTVACIPLLLYFFRDMSWPTILRRTIPYAALFVIFLLIRASVISKTSADISLMTYLDNPILAAQNMNERAGMIIYCMGKYLLTLIFPYTLSCDYSYNSIPVTGIGNPLVILSLLIYILLGWVAIKGFRTKNIFSFCILWFFITISIFSSIFITSSNAYADRFLYTPSLAICLAVAFALYKLAGLEPSQQFLSSFNARKAITGALLMIITGLFIAKTVSYAPVWKNDMTLFEFNLKINPQNARMLKNYGGEMVRTAMFMRQDTSAQKRDDTATIFSLCRRGLVELQKARAIYPRDAIGQIHEANAQIILGNLAEAEKNLVSALSIHSTNRYAFTSLGYIYYSTGRYREAAVTWEKIDPALRQPNDNYNLYLAYMMSGDQQRANYYKQLSGR